MVALTQRVPDLGALDLLVSVGALGSLGRAAARHGITPQAASSRIRYMERLVGLPLVSRSRAGSTLTPAGALAVDWAQAVIDAAGTLEAGLAALRQEQEGHLRLSASMPVAEYLMPQWLIAMAVEYPDLDVSLCPANSDHVARDVLNGDVEPGYVEGPGLPAGLQSRTVAHDRLEVVVAPTHPWALRRHGLSACELAGTRLIQREPGSGTRYTLAKVLEPYEPTAAPLVELSSTVAVKAAVHSGHAPAVISSLAVASEIADQKLVSVPVVDLDLRRELRAVWRGGHSLLGPLRDFVAVSARSLSDRQESTG